MLLREIMSRDIESIRPDCTLQEAARKMKWLDVGMLPICSHERVVGVITDRDIAIRAVADGLDPALTLVGQIMTLQALHCFEDDDANVAERMMEEYQIRRLLVFDHDKHPVGVISLGDLATRLGDIHASGKVLEQVSHA